MIFLLAFQVLNEGLVEAIVGPFNLSSACTHTFNDYTHSHLVKGRGDELESS